jgi:hypothetical protein
VFPSDLPGVNPATLNGIILYYRLMTKWSGLGDSTGLSRVGLSQMKIEEGTKRYDQHHRRHVPDAISLRHPPIPAPSRVEVIQATHHMHYLETTFIKQG